MELLAVFNIGIIIGCLLMILSVLWINIILWKGYIVVRKIKENTYQIRKDLTNEKVEEYIKYIDCIDIPPKKYYWNILKARYKIVELNNSIDKKYWNS